jgi:hypothetical protein
MRSYTNLGSNLSTKSETAAVKAKQYLFGVRGSRRKGPHLGEISLGLHIDWMKVSCRMGNLERLDHNPVTHPVNPTKM